MSSDSFRCSPSFRCRPRLSVFIAKAIIFHCHHQFHFPWLKTRYCQYMLHMCMQCSVLLCFWLPAFPAIASTERKEEAERQRDGWGSREYGSLKGFSDKFVSSCKMHNSVCSWGFKSVWFQCYCVPGYVCLCFISPGRSNRISLSFICVFWNKQTKNAFSSLVACKSIKSLNRCLQWI